MADGVLGAEEDAFDVHGEDEVPFRFGDLVGGLVHTRDPGVVDEDIQLAEGSADVRKDFFDVAFIADVQAPELGLTAGCFDVAHRLLAVLFG